MKRIVCLLKRIWYGECPDCHVILNVVKGWGRSECPKCGTHFKD